MIFFELFHIIMKKICFAWQVTLAIYSPRTPSYFFHHIEIWKHKYHNIFHEQFIIHLLSEDLFERSRHHKERKGILYDIILEKHFRSLFGGIWVQGHNILDQFSCDIKENIYCCASWTELEELSFVVDFVPRKLYCCCFYLLLSI